MADINDELNGDIEEDNDEIEDDLEGLSSEFDVDAITVTEEPMRLGIESGVVQHKTLAELEESTQGESDLKTIARYLHYQYKDPILNELLQSAASSRIYPDNYQDKCGAMFNARLLLAHEPDEIFDVFGEFSIIQDGISRGLEGRQRLEDLELAGVAHEEEMEELSKKLGI